MPSQRRHFKIVIACATFAAATLGYFGLRKTEPTLTDGAARPVATVSSATAPTPTRTDERGSASAPTPLSPETLRTPRPQPSVPAAVHELLPSVDRAITNWKEFKPQKITIAPYPDMPIEFEATSIREDHGRTVWTGRNAAVPGAFLVAVATDDEWHATLAIPPAGNFEANIVGSSVTTLERQDWIGNCGTVPAMALSVPSAVDSSDAIPAVAAAATNTVDVLFFYDADTLTAFGGNASSIETRLISYIESANAALQNSQVTTFRWRYLAAYQVPAYTATNDMTDDLHMMTGVLPNTNNPGTYRSVPNAVSTFVQQKADLHGADQTVLYVGGNRNFAGIAWLSPGSQLSFHTAVVIWPSSYRTVAHELGHGFGCHHDRTTENAADNDGHFYYGFRYTQFGQDRGTIMSYANFVVDYYSNPDVTFSGVVLGVPENQPKAANNARVLREAAQSLIDSRPAVDPPSITSQPQSVTVTAGNSFSLSVTATGGNLTYQWKFKGTAILGATSATFSKSVAATADQGDYTVTVTNIAGETTSSPATVTVNAAVPVTPQTTNPAPSSGGGGGGGGALDAWFATCGAFLVLARWASRRSRN